MTESQAIQLGRIVRSARLKKGWSLAATMERVGIDQAWLNRLELGRYADPDPVHLAHLAEALDIDPARIDRVSKNHLADSMPTMRTYLRSKEKLSPEAMDSLEQALADIRAEDAARRAGASPAPRKTGGTP
jgi:transcriptional regulator with XRE-family HTH domain